MSNIKIQIFEIQNPPEIFRRSLSVNMPCPPLSFKPTRSTRAKRSGCANQAAYQWGVILTISLRCNQANAGAYNEYNLENDKIIDDVKLKVTRED